MYIYNRNYIKYIIESKNIQMIEIADKMGINPQVLTYKMRTKSFKIEEIFKLLEILEISFEELFKVKK